MSVLVAVVSGTEITCLGNGSIDSDRTRVIRASVRTRTAAHPTGKSEARICVRLNGHTRSGVMPADGRSHRPTAPRGHGQVVLRRKGRRVGRVTGRRNRVRNRAVVTPLGPDVLNA